MATTPSNTPPRNTARSQHDASREALRRLTYTPAEIYAAGRRHQQQARMKLQTPRTIQSTTRLKNPPRLRLVTSDWQPPAATPPTPTEAATERKPASPTPRMRLSERQPQPRPLIARANASKPDRSRSSSPVLEPTDPRWVLAIRVADKLQGSIFPPDARESLIRLGKSMGLTAFDSNMIIAIVQDQARRGHTPAYCPAAGAAQLAMITPPMARRPDARVRSQRLRIATLCTGLLAVELLLLLAWWS